LATSTIAPEDVQTHVFKQQKSHNLDSGISTPQVMLRMLNAKKAAEFAQTHLDLHPAKIEDV